MLCNKLKEKSDFENTKMMANLQVLFNQRFQWWKMTSFESVLSNNTTLPPRSPVARWSPDLSNSIADMISTAKLRSKSSLAKVCNDALETIKAKICTKEKPISTMYNHITVAIIFNKQACFYISIYVSNQLTKEVTDAV